MCAVRAEWEGIWLVRMVQAGIEQMQRLWQQIRQTPLARVALILLCLALIVQSVRLFFALVTPLGPVGDAATAGANQLSQDERAALFARIDPFYRTNDNGATGTNAVTSLPLQLFGIRVNQAIGAGSAIIAGEDGQQNSIGVGEEIQPGVRLLAVHFDHVEIDNGGRRELLYLDQTTGAATAATASAQPAANLVSANTTATVAPAGPISPQSLRSGISWTARMEGNRATGIIVREQGDGTAFLAAGFRNGDIIRAVNGRAINSPSDIAALTNQLQPGARLSLEVERGAGTVPIAITIPAGNP